MYNPHAVRWTDPQQDAIIASIITGITEETVEEVAEAMDQDALAVALAYAKETTRTGKRKDRAKEKGKNIAIAPRRFTTERRNPNIVILPPPPLEELRKRMKRPTVGETVKERNLRIRKIIRKANLMPETRGSYKKFYDEESKELYDQLCTKGMITEVNIFSDKFDEVGVANILTINELDMATAYVKPFLKKVVLEFYSNFRLVEDMENPLYGKVIYEEIKSFLANRDSRRISFPSLIYNMLRSQKELDEIDETLEACQLRWHGRQDGIEKHMEIHLQPQ